MRKALWGMLMAAGALLPGLASAQDRDGDFRGRGGRGGAETRAPRPDGNGPAGQRWGGGERGGYRGNWQPRPAPQQAAAPQAQARQFDGRRDGGSAWQGRNRTPGQGFQGRLDRPTWQGGDNRRDWRGNQRPPVGWQRDRADWQDHYRDQWRSQERAAWNRGWRSDDRYDWNRYRSGNRGAYHLPRYYAPYGWGYGYRRFSAGVVLSDVLFARNYWIDDPWDYRLPPADEPYRWVRYYNDALLVDVYSGQVVDTVYDIFW